MKHLYFSIMSKNIGITNKENFQYQKGDINNVYKSVIMMIMMKNIKMDPRLKKETVNEIFKKENNNEKKAKPQIKMYSYKRKKRWNKIPFK